MTRRASKRWKNFRRGTPAGKKVTIAETDQIDAHREIATQFMFAIFELDPGDYLITDESDILDFTSADDMDTTEIWRRIETTYNLNQTDVGSGRLVRIFDAIAVRRSTQ